VPFPHTRFYIRDKKLFVELTMLANVVGYFIELKNQYTRYNLEVMLSLNSVYSQRLFEIIMLYKGRKQYIFRYTVTTLQTVLNCNYPNWYDFKKRVLEPAKKDLNEKAKILLEYSPSAKKGKKVIEIEFTIKSELETHIENTKEELRQYDQMDIAQIYQSAIQLLGHYDFTNAQKEKILSDFNLIKSFIVIHAKLASGQAKKVKNPTAYVAQSLGFGKK
jgi:plasmid replication initiation protein